MVWADMSVFLWGPAGDFMQVASRMVLTGRVGERGRGHKRMTLGLAVPHPSSDSVARRNRRTTGVSLAYVLCSSSTVVGCKHVGRSGSANGIWWGGGQQSAMEAI